MRENRCCPGGYEIAFGPVPSRRLGMSLGINNIPPKTCSYNCRYCRLGGTDRTTVTRETFYSPADVVGAVAGCVAQLRHRRETPDFLTFVPDGEPTLDENLGWEIQQLHALGIRIAVISNASLLSDPRVRRDLAGADWVSVKVDTVDDETWRTVNRSRRDLSLQGILEGIRRFTDDFHGHLATETMLLQGMNDQEDCLEAVARFLREIAPDRAYLAIPTRPPTDPAVRAPSEEAVIRAHAVFCKHLPSVEYLCSLPDRTRRPADLAPE